MKRRIALATVAVVALVGAAVVVRSHRTHLVRVGGMGNACTCTQRIEP